MRMHFQNNFLFELNHCTLQQYEQFISKYSLELIIEMGQEFCKPHTYDSDLNNDPFKFQQHKDQRQNSMTHSRSLRCKNEQLQKILDRYEQFLKQGRSMYKDPLLKSEQVTLKSRDKEIRCQYERPYKFIYEGDKNTPYQVYNRETTINASCIRVNDPVMQYFGVFLCFLADHQKLIQKIIVTEQNTYGLHVVSVNHRGRQQFLLVDDLILCQSNNPRFSQPVYLGNTRQKPFLWPCIVQKAWLKLKGSAMRKIMRVSPQQVFEQFLPFPIQKVMLEGQEQTVIVRKLKHYLYQIEQGNGCILTSKEQPKHKIGLSGKKNYYYLFSFNFDGKRLFYIRNPCVNFDFRGSYFEVPQSVSKILSEDYGINSIPQGNFILDEEQLIEQIAFASIVHYKDGVSTTCESITFEPNKQFFVSFQLNKAAPFCLRLTQYTQGNDTGLQNFYPLTYHLVNTSDRTIVGGMQNQEACFGVKNSYFLSDVVKVISPGKYVLRLKKKPSHRPIHTNDCMLIANYVSPIRFTYTNQQQLTARYYDILGDVCDLQLKRKIAQYSPNKKMVSKQDVDHVVSWFGDIVTVYIKKNNERKQTVKLQVFFPHLLNLKCISHKQLRKGEHKQFEIKDDLLIVFQKVDLTEQTQLNKYQIQAY